MKQWTVRRRRRYKILVSTIPNSNESFHNFIMLRKANSVKEIPWKNNFLGSNFAIT